MVIRFIFYFVVQGLLAQLLDSLLPYSNCPLDAEYQFFYVNRKYKCIYRMAVHHRHLFPINVCIKRSIEYLIYLISVPMKSYNWFPSIHFRFQLSFEWSGEKENIHDGYSLRLIEKGDNLRKFFYDEESVFPCCLLFIASHISSVLFWLQFDWNLQTAESSQCRLRVPTWLKLSWKFEFFFITVFFSYRKKIVSSN